MKSKASKSQTIKAAFHSSTAAAIKASQAVPSARKSQPTKTSSSLKNEYRVDRAERGRSPTVRALIWDAAMTPMKPAPATTPLKNGSQVSHVEFAVPAQAPRGTVPKSV